MKTSKKYFIVAHCINDGDKYLFSKKLKGVYKTAKAARDNFMKVDISAFESFKYVVLTVKDEKSDIGDPTDCYYTVSIARPVKNKKKA